MRELKDLVEDIRGRGWSVAVHNDYRLHGQRHTFWLFTCDGRTLCVKGEGRTDEEALTQALAAIEGLGPLAHFIPRTAAFLDWLQVQVALYRDLRGGNNTIRSETYATALQQAELLLLGADEALRRQQCAPPS
jgi:hypothetical protein